MRANGCGDYSAGKSADLLWVAVWLLAVCQRTVSSVSLAAAGFGCQTAAKNHDFDLVASGGGLQCTATAMDIEPMRGKGSSFRSPSSASAGGGATTAKGMTDTANTYISNTSFAAYVPDTGGSHLLVLRRWRL